MYKRRVFTHTWKPMEDLAFVDPGSLERLMDPVTCPRCGMSSEEWTAGAGNGYVADSHAYCCRGCADGRGCTCHELASHEHSLEIWQGVSGLSPEEEHDLDEPEEEPIDVLQPFDRHPFTLNWHAERRTSEEAPTDEDADDSDEGEDAEGVDEEQPSLDAPSGSLRGPKRASGAAKDEDLTVDEAAGDAAERESSEDGGHGPQARRPKAAEAAGLDVIDLELEREAAARPAPQRAPRPKPKRRTAEASSVSRARPTDRRSRPQPRAGQHSATRRAGAGRRRSKRR